MSLDWQGLVVGACVLVSAAHLSLRAWPSWPKRTRRALGLRLLRAPHVSLRYRIGRRLAAPARGALNARYGNACGTCKACAQRMPGNRDL